MQFESSLPVFVLGGIDCILNVLRIVISIVFFASYPISSGSTVGIYLPYKMNIWRQFNLANQSFLGDWLILYW